ncbi:hypothetical protein [Pedosphaera parvula]|uniref:hypothetical protein n=1 Tax=Pedosphaera parvula TaxID=1032527 RepID=UPI0002DC9F81|nr:hypothetical protein [Pedosphaera parvula]
MNEIGRGDAASVTIVEVFHSVGRSGCSIWRGPSPMDWAKIKPTRWALGMRDEGDGRLREELACSG